MTSRIVTADNTEDPVCDSKLSNIAMYLITQTIRMSQILQTGLQKAGDVLILYLAGREQNKGFTPGRLTPGSMRLT